jgi:isoamylase
MTTPQMLRENARARLLELVGEGFALRRGHPIPLGATPLRDGVNFAVFSSHAAAMTLVLFHPGDTAAALELPLDPTFHRTGNVWHVFVAGLEPGVEYAYRASPAQAPAGRARVDEERLLLDPWARSVSGAAEWGASAPAVFRPRRGRVVEDGFDWGADRPLNHHLADSVIYEVNVRAFTAHPSAAVAHPGTFRGIVEKIPYLKQLGVTAVELMPVTEYEECEIARLHPKLGKPLRNLWGYQPLALFAPKAGFAASGRQGGELSEMREMVAALHRAGIEVVLDMVFNHTGEGDETGPVLSFRGLDDAVYYMREPGTGRYLDFTGCGNTLNCNHPVVRSLIVNALRYWATELHVDGFRFDLAAVLGRGPDGNVLRNPPLLEEIALDPVLAETKLIAEAWDAAGLYQVGEFGSHGRWAEWNGRFRDDVRRFARGDGGMVGTLATRLAGSADLYQDDGRAPWHSVNFVTCHDGFTLRDLVSHAHRHNEANGEGNRDGNAAEISFNCGVEGETHVPDVLRLRARQQRNLAALLLLSQGVPMLLSGDELGRSQHGNNNAYCQDDETSHLDWGLARVNADLLRFFERMLAFRRAHPSLRRRSYAADDDRPWIAWHGARLAQPDWSGGSRLLAFHLLGGSDDDIFVAINGSDDARSFALPALANPGRRWRLVADTAALPPRDVAEPGQEPPVEGASRRLEPRSLVVLVGL